MEIYEPRCKVCTSRNRKVYEERWLETPRPTLEQMQELARMLNEDISYKSFERHFKNHFNPGIAELAAKEESITQVVEEAKKEVIDIVSEIRSNLNGLKALLSQTLAATQAQGRVSPTLIRSLTDLYREHRQSIEACERLTSKLTEGTTLTEGELLKLMYIFAKDLCPECREKFKITLDEYLARKRQHG
ncbi:MAG: hypothetical protein OH337_03710 [Candidatus Parvarchaeota archaeon]|nr:hypothetical protein [Candidatus Haiyanarchaeum thermophilum]